MKEYALEIPKDAIQIELAHGDNSDSKKEISEIFLSIGVVNLLGHRPPSGSNHSYQSFSRTLS